MALGNAFGSVSDTDKDAVDAGRDAITAALMDNAAVASTAPGPFGGFSGSGQGSFGFTGSKDSIAQGAYGTPDYGPGQQPGTTPGGGFTMGTFAPGWSGGNVPSDVDMTPGGWGGRGGAMFGAPTATPDMFGPPGSPLSDQVFGPDPFTSPPDAPSWDAPADFNPAASEDQASLSSPGIAEMAAAAADTGDEGDGNGEGGGVG